MQKKPRAVRSRQAAAAVALRRASQHFRATKGWAGYQAPAGLLPLCCSPQPRSKCAVRACGALRVGDCVRCLCHWQAHVDALPPLSERPPLRACVGVFAAEPVEHALSSPPRWRGALHRWLNVIVAVAIAAARLSCRPRRGRGRWLHEVTFGMPLLCLLVLVPMLHGRRMYWWRWRWRWRRRRWRCPAWLLPKRLTWGIGVRVGMQVLRRWDVWRGSYHC